MKSSYLLLLSLLVCLSVTQIKKSAADLVDDTCKKTPNYDVCSKTIRPDPRSRGANVAGLAIIVVETIAARSTNTVNRINTLLASTSDPKAKEALNRCLSKYGAILDGDIPSATEAIQKGNPKFAVSGLNDAGSEAQSCERSFGGSSPISIFNNNVIALSKVASAIAALL